MHADYLHACQCLWQNYHNVDRVEAGLHSRYTGRLVNGRVVLLSRRIGAGGSGGSVDKS